MTRMESPSPLPGAAPDRRVLSVVTGALLVAVLFFVVVVGFLAIEAVRRPDVGASMYGKGRFYTGTGAGAYWGPFAVYTALLLGGVVAVLARVRQRLRRGERIGPPADAMRSRRPG